MIVTLINSQNVMDIDLDFFEEVSGYISDKFDRDSTRELNIIFVDKQKIRQLNRHYRNKDSETDVLSFSYSNCDKTHSFDREHGFSVLGEIIISPEVALENTKNIKKDDFDPRDLKKEIILLIIHGILHIYAYDHEKRDEKIEMESIQDSLLKDVFLKFDV